MESALLPMWRPRGRMGNDICGAIHWYGSLANKTPVQVSVHWMCGNYWRYRFSGSRKWFELIVYLLCLARLYFGNVDRCRGVVTVDVPLQELEINQCYQSYNIQNAFKNTARCHYASQTVSPPSLLKKLSLSHHTKLAILALYLMLQILNHEHVYHQVWAKFISNISVNPFKKYMYILNIRYLT